jgi:hypothetical protein
MPILISQPLDWYIYLNIKITCDLDNGTIQDELIHRRKVRLRIKNYDDGLIDGEIQTYNASNLVNVNQQIVPGANTKVVGVFEGYHLFPCIYTPVQDSGSGSVDYVQTDSGSGSFSNGEGDLATCPEYYGILEIDIPNGGPTSIKQISTLYNADTGVWIGPMSTNKARLIAYPYASPPRIEIDATLDYNYLSTSLPYYKLSARLGRVAETICDVSIMLNTEKNVTTISNGGINGFTINQLLVFASDDENTCANISSVSGTTITFINPVRGGIKIVCTKDVIVDTNAADFYTNASLVGLTIDDFLLFNGSLGIEQTTRTGVSFNSGTGTLTGVGSGPIKITFHEALISDTVSAVTSYTDNLILGYAPQDVMIFVNGIEQTHRGATISGDTITFPSSVTGSLKIVLVNQ